jgi:cysteinyl-tRNA synthetase
MRLYDSATRQVEDFVPLTPGQVGIYVCGATVQSAPHIGHLRPAVCFDILRRWFSRTGYQVTLIRNVTDIDDKILAKSAEAGTQWWAHAAVMEREFSNAYNALGVLPPTYEPHATAHVPEMIALMQTLMDNEHAYTTGPGDVWFDVLSWPQYGELTRQKLDELEPEPLQPAPIAGGFDASDGGAGAFAGPQLAALKKSPYDFALWKAPKPGEPATASWDTPWGRGRPGWHLECTAMACKYLGPQFDIHGGGLDLRFPHHENEQAQARAAGAPFANHWVHTAWITQSGAKMSKSLGNGLLASTVLGQAPGFVVRYAIAGVQYRSMLEWTPDTLTDAANAAGRLTGFVTRATEFLSSVSSGGSAPASDGGFASASDGGLAPASDSGSALGAPTPDEISAAPLPPEFVAAMNDDLNTPEALAVIHAHLKTGNTALSQAEAAQAGAPKTADKATATTPETSLAPANAAKSSDLAQLTALVRAELLAVRAMLDVLGLDPLDPQWASATASADDTAAKALDKLVQTDLAARTAARAAKDWARADEIRGRLATAGITIEDSPTGPRYTLT